MNIVLNNHNKTYPAREHSRISFEVNHTWCVLIDCCIFQKIIIQQRKYISFLLMSLLFTVTFLSKWRS